MRQKVSVLGATGSIGTQTLDVLAAHPEAFEVFALTAAQAFAPMLARCRQFRPALAVMADPTLAKALEVALRAEDIPTTVLHGLSGLAIAASDPSVDIVVAGIVGMAGLAPTLAAARAGKRILLANKEALVVAGALLMQTVHASGAKLLPIDSEHNGIFQCLGPHYQTGITPHGVKDLCLTASGGPFLRHSLKQLQQVTPQEACAHPTWRMGAKISVDSATMMNKGLELIEAAWLFDMPLEKISILVHPQSIVHALVSFTDGSVLAHMGQPDMRIPIAHALAWPGRLVMELPPLDWAKIAQLHFETFVPAQFPCVGLARDALQHSSGAPVVLNAANEVAVAAFLAGKIAFTEIPRLIAEAMAALAAPVESIEDIFALNYETRALTDLQIAKLCMHS